MKKSFPGTLILLLVLAGTTLAQSPSTIVYQGRITDAAGVAIEGNTSVRFSIWSALTAGSELWFQQKTVSAVAGVFTVELGPIPGPTTVFDGNARYLELKVEDESAMVPRQVINAVPYALSAGKAPGASGTVTSVAAGGGLSASPSPITSTGVVSIATGGVTGSHILDGTITAADIGSSAVGASELATSSVASANIIDGTITATDIGANAIGSSELQETVTFGGGKVTINNTTQGDGFINTYAADGSEAIRLTTYADPGAGGIVVYNAAGTAICGLRGDNGLVWGASKSFVEPDPTAPGRMIQYTSLEGPEAGIYFRGTANLVDGRASVSFPAHFAALAAPSSLTVSLTPRSADSRGLAATAIDDVGMEVVELAGGKGNYSFYYLVQCGRKGYENYRVYRSQSEFQAEFLGQAAEEPATRTVED